MKTFRFVSESEEMTRAFARRLGERLGKNDCLALVGDFGSGKTSFVKGLAQGLEVGKKTYVSSPSFVILKIYRGRLKVYHFDLYRLKSAADLDAIGFHEFMTAGGVCVVEWAQKAGRALPKSALKICFSVAGDTKRELSCRASSPRQARLLAGVFR